RRAPARKSNALASASLTALPTPKPIFPPPPSRARAGAPPRAWRQPQERRGALAPLLRFGREQSGKPKPVRNGEVEVMADRRSSQPSRSAQHPLLTFTRQETASRLQTQIEEGTQLLHAVTTANNDRELDSLRRN